MGLIANWSSVQFSRSLMSDSLRSRELHPARPLCPSPTPRVYPNSYPSSQWCHPAISSSVVSFSFCPQSLRASESFPMSQLFAWRGQRIGVSASASALPMNTQDWSHLGWTSWISLQIHYSKRCLRSPRHSRCPITHLSSARLCSSAFKDIILLN